MGLLCHPLSVLDVAALHTENSAATAAPRADGEGHPSTNKLSYEQFYGWLLVLARQLYPEENNAKKALHLLITEASTIIPVAVCSFDNAFMWMHYSVSFRPHRGTPRLTLKEMR